MKEITIDIDMVCKRHEECRQAFISEMGAARSHLNVNQMAQARYHLLRANGAVGQGLIWADLLAISESGWLDRMMEIMKVWEVTESKNGGL